MISQLDLFPAIGSTNDELLTSTIKIGKAAVCLTEMQMAGRGRRGNVWHSNPFRNITMSVAYKFPAWPEATPSFALAAAVAITNLLRSKLGVNALIKWPNDLLVDRKKLGGILVEAAGAYDSDCLLVVGLGLNLHQRNEATLAGSDYQWTSLNDLGAGFGRNQLVADIIEALLDTFILFEQVGFAPFVEHWQTLSAFDGQRVRVIDKQDSFVGVQRGVDATGALMVEGYNGKVHQINDAGATVRGVDE
jgi:BirA family biotin operon repressor/biotin-[acetyl-CoA-carboxylase] ligase